MRFSSIYVGFVFACAAFGQGGFSGPGSYEITNIKSGKVIDLDRNDQTTVIQFSSRGTDNQTWYIQNSDSGFYFFRNGMTGAALSATGGNASPLQGRPFNGDISQQWSIEPGKDGNAIISSRQGKAFDVPDGTNRDGARLQIYDRNGDSNQRFTFRQVGGGRNVRPGWMGNQNQNVGGRGGGGGGANVRCSSDDGGRHYCDADTRSGVQMMRQISSSACIQNQTWGFDNRGIWVDRGCRAEFQVNTAGNNTGGYNPGDNNGNYNNNNAAIITCASDDGRRHYCDADTRNGVQMTRQISGSACKQGQTWGFDNRGIWVDRGCRAEFQLNTNNGRPRYNVQEDRRRP